MTNMNSSPSDGGTDEPDMQGPDMNDENEDPQEHEHPTITTPNKATQTTESLSLLGAGQPYRILNN